MSLKPQVGGYFDYGGTFASLKNGEMLAMCGIGDWITGVLQKDGAPVASVIPEEGGIQWTESYSIGKGTDQARDHQQVHPVHAEPRGAGEIDPDGGLSGPVAHQIGLGRDPGGEPDRGRALGPAGGHATRSRSNCCAKAASISATSRASNRWRTGTTSGPNTRPPDGKITRRGRAFPAPRPGTNTGVHESAPLPLPLCLAAAPADLAGAVLHRAAGPDGRDVVLAGAQLPHAARFRVRQLGADVLPRLLSGTPIG
jgi:hypothetical protein